MIPRSNQIGTIEKVVVFWVWPKNT